MLPQSRDEQVPSRSRSPVVLPAVMAANGAVLAVLLGLDGSPGWRAVRILVAMTVTALAVWFTRRAGRTGQGATALPLGVVGMVAGTGVASGHLAKAGIDAAAVTAAIVVFAAAVLGVCATGCSGRQPPASGVPRPPTPSAGPGAATGAR